ncbi:hypothetical protein R1flu_003461 [Riccia fluitans]|uniref:NAD-dependent epimerase/dehydratase domain-containing protein n=1 Tax=Riccia fluitans TaxID=41844 RepID=A0ABD1Y930_9MARC
MHMHGAEHQEDTKLSMAVGKIVAVTGANGYIAFWLVKLLLERGYTVRGTIRDPDVSEKVKYLLELPGAKERLTLHKAHLLEDGVFDEIFAGCEGVFHTASPTMQGDVPDMENTMLLPAVKGTLNVLNSAAKAGTVRRVVFTSSHAAVSISDAAQYPQDPNVVIDETWWSDPEWSKKKKMWYMLSKLRAEEAAWDFMKKDQNFDLVVINPAVVIGPVPQGTLNSSCGMILEFLDGSKEEYPYFTFAFVHLNDCALAHILVFENPSANGRYCLADKSMHSSQLMNLLRSFCPDAPIPDKCAENRKPVSGKFGADRIKELGLAYTPTDEVLKEFITVLRTRKWLKY